jgi:xylulokinase
MGAMTPKWNEIALGTFYGFTLSHTRDHFTRALLEGSAYAVRDITDRMSSTGLKLQEIRVMGGGAKSRLWNQIKADVTGLPVAVPHIIETTALGAALLALVGVGVYSTLYEACTRVVKIHEYLEPQTLNKRIYDEQYNLYRQLYSSLEPVFESSARISSGNTVAQNSAHPEIP